MKKVKIFLETISDVKNFVHIVGNYDFAVDLVSGRYSVDAKSIMGIFSLDLTKPVDAEIHSENETEIAKFLNEINKFIVK
ncbi:MAG: HPr family phosphocarrier protein [Oscillospiraceae bacterium]|nr:HPr family phosphocarrier protein [Oscillospiraceae bacterium]